MKKSILISCVLVLCYTPAMADSERVAGAALWQQHNCAACHGQDAKSSISPDYPVLAGQHADYLQQALLAYQRGQKGAAATTNIRKNPVMGALAVNLSASEIEQLSVWLAGLPGPLSYRH